MTTVEQSDTKVERLAQKVDDSIQANLLIAGQVTDLASKVDDLQRTLDELIGAKKALMLITGFVATAIGLFISWLGLHKQ